MKPINYEPQVMNSDLFIFLSLKTIPQIGGLYSGLLENIRNPARKLKFSMFDISKDGSPIGAT